MRGSTVEQLTCEVCCPWEEMEVDGGPRITRTYTTSDALQLDTEDMPDDGADARARVGDELTGDDFLQFLVVHPDGRFRIAWALSGTLLIAYDVLVIPLAAFELDPSVVMFA